MNDDYVNLPTYTAHIDDAELSPETMTDAGIPVSEVTPVGECILTPGDPSPCGRIEEGDLVYPVFKSHTYLRMARSQAAYLAHLAARDLGITELPDPPYRGKKLQLFVHLINEALPPKLFGDSAHGQLLRNTGVNSIIAGDLDDLPVIIYDKERP